MTENGQDREWPQGQPGERSTDGDRAERPDAEQQAWSAQQEQGASWAQPRTERQAGGSSSAWGSEDPQRPAWGAPGQPQQGGWSEGGSDQRAWGGQADQGQQRWGQANGNDQQGAWGAGGQADQQGWGGGGQGQQGGYDQQQAGWGGGGQGEEGQQQWSQGQGGSDQQQPGWGAGGSSSAWGSPGQGQGQQAFGGSWGGQDQPGGGGQGGWGPPPGQGAQGPWAQQPDYGYGQPPPAKNRSWIIALTALGVAVVLALLVFAFNSQRDSTSPVATDTGAGTVGQPLTGGDTVDVTELTVGTCVQDPLAGATEGQVSDIQTVDCTQPHDEEVFAVYDMPGGSSDPFPGDQAVIDESNTGCQGRFEAYVGRDYFSSELDITTIYPTAMSWAMGDREVVCMAYRMDGQQLTEPVQGSGM